MAQASSKAARRAHPPAGRGTPPSALVAREWGRSSRPQVWATAAVSAASRPPSRALPPPAERRDEGNGSQAPAAHAPAPSQCRTRRRVRLPPEPRPREPCRRDAALPWALPASACRFARWTSVRPRFRALCSIATCPRPLTRMPEGARDVMLSLTRNRPPRFHHRARPRKSAVSALASPLPHFVHYASTLSQQSIAVQAM